jgi:hypothetical protein
MEKFGDYSQVPNIAYQYAAEGKLKPTSVLLYGFFCSVSGWEKIHPSQQYIQDNTGLSRGTIQTGLKELIAYGLIKEVMPATKFQTREIALANRSTLPSRVLKKEQDESKKKIALTNESSNIPIQGDVMAFEGLFKALYLKRTSKTYEINDWNLLGRITDYKLAQKQIIGYWRYQDENPDKASTYDHSLRLFTSLLKKGHMLVNYFKKTRHGKMEEQMQKELTEDQRQKLDKISRELGISLFTLLEGKSAETVIRDYESGTLKMLNE